MIINNLFYEHELRADVSYYCPERPAAICHDHDSPRFSDSGDNEEIEFELSIVLNVSGTTHTIPLSEMDKVVALRPLVADIYRALVDDVTEGARIEYGKNSIAYTLEMKS